MQQELLQNDLQCEGITNEAFTNGSLECKHQEDFKRFGANDYWKSCYGV